MQRQASERLTQTPREREREERKRERERKIERVGTQRENQPHGIVNFNGIAGYHCSVCSNHLVKFLKQQWRHNRSKQALSSCVRVWVPVCVLACVRACVWAACATHSCTSVRARSPIAPCITANELKSLVPSECNQQDGVRMRNDDIDENATQLNGLAGCAGLETTFF